MHRGAENQVSLNMGGAIRADDGTVPLVLGMSANEVSVAAAKRPVIFFGVPANRPKRTRPSTPTVEVKAEGGRVGHPTRRVTFSLCCVVSVLTSVTTVRCGSSVPEKRAHARTVSKNRVLLCVVVYCGVWLCVVVCD